MEKAEKGKVCRVCLTKIKTFGKWFYLHEKSENSLSLGTNHQESILIAEKITVCSGVKIIEGDSLPNRICSDCLSELEVAYNFKRKCEKSDDILRFAFKYGSKTEEHEVFTEHNVDGVDHEFSDFEPALSDYDTDIKQESKESVLNEVAIKYEDPDIPQTTDEFTQELNKQVDQSASDSIDDKVEMQINLKPSKAIDLKLECDYCGNLFKTKFILGVHIKREHPTIFSCSFCNLEFKTYKAYIKHNKNRSKTCIRASMMRKEGKGKSTIFHCKQCKFSTTNRNNIKQHLVIHSNDISYSCDLCDKIFLRACSFQSHKERIHKVFKIERTCNICGQVILGQYYYQQHRNKHRTQLYQCDICKQYFRNKGAMIQHIERHRNLKEHACKHCDSVFNTATALWQHIDRYHKNKEKSCCKFCGYTGEKRIIKKHEMKHKSHNIACLICGRFFENDFQLSMHKKRHTERNFQCEYCKKTFFGKGCLGKHLRRCKLR